MSRQTTFEEFRALAAGGGVVAVVREFAADTLTPVTAFAAIHRPPFGFLLESLVGGERWARYTFLGTEPSCVERERAGVAELWSAADGGRPAGPAPDPGAHMTG